MNSPRDNVNEDDNVNENDNAMEEEGAIALSPEDIQNLNRIEDFDIATRGDRLSEFLRIGRVDAPGDASKSEINLILWLILEKELQNVDERAVNLARKNIANLHQQAEDNVDAANNSPPRYPAGPALPRPGSGVGDPFAGLSGKERRRTASYSGKARKTIEDLLRSAGFPLPFHQLSVNERKALFQQFANASVMLTPVTPQHDSSLPELFEALRTKSRLKEEFKLGERLGGGQFGEVFAVTSRRSGVKYAAKRISLGLDCFEEMRMTLNESRILKSINHENIIRCYDAWLEMHCDPSRAAETSSSEAEKEPLKFYVLLEFCYQSFSEWIIEVRKKPDHKEMVLILKQTLAGVRFLHSNGILHLDINTRNILWADSARTTLKIGDFGLAIKVGESYPYNTGTLPYAAPDWVFTAKSDIYSLGVTILEVAENIATMSELVERIDKMTIRTNFPFLNNVLPLVLSKHPNIRPTAEQFQTMMNRVLNPPVRPRLELEPEDYRLVGVQPGPPPHPILMEAVMEDEDDEGNENEAPNGDIDEEPKDPEDE